MRLLIIADIDDIHWTHKTGPAEVLLSCGDVADQVILEAAAACGCRAVFAVKGNHDNHTPFPKPIVDLHLQNVVHAGFSFSGLNGAWKYKPRGSFLYEQGEVESFLANLSAADIFLSHNSPRGIHDREDGVHTGFAGLNTYMARTAPNLVIHGHQHIERETVVCGTRVISVYGHKLLEIPHD